MSLEATKPPPNRKLIIEYVPTDQVRPDPRNPRQRPKSQVIALAKGIDEHDQCLPICVDDDLQIITGEGIWLRPDTRGDLGGKSMTSLQAERASSSGSIRAVGVAPRAWAIS
jgi:hypothetical protein